MCFLSSFVYSKPTKISRKFLEDGTKVRVSKLSGHIIPKPVYSRKPRSLGKLVVCLPMLWRYACELMGCVLCCLCTVLGPKDTPVEEVEKVTFADYEKYLPFIYASKTAAK